AAKGTFEAVKARGLEAFRAALRPLLPFADARAEGRFEAGRIFVMLNRGAYWQCAYVAAKGTFEAVKARGLEAFRAALRPLLPFADARA
ncbi:hypothetical protein CNY89_28120, partial [Amaricoccus sp. HAR-UPW-R2A-40]